MERTKIGTGNKHLNVSKGGKDTPALRQSAQIFFSLRAGSLLNRWKSKLSLVFWHETLLGSRRLLCSLEELASAQIFIRAVKLSLSF